MANITVQDIINQTQDYVRNYTTGTADLGNTLRAVNRGVEYVKRRLTLPSDDTIYNFYYSGDQLYYDLPAAAGEPLQLLYNNTTYNTPQTSWEWRPYPDILNLTGTSDSNLWSTTSINGKNQLIMLGANLQSGSQLATFDSLSGFSGLYNSITLAIDTNVKTEGSGSLSFTIDPTLGYGKAAVTWPVQWDVSSLHSASGAFKMDAYMPSIALTDVKWYLFTDSGNYYVFTCTTQDNGTAFSVNAWNRLHWSFNDNPVIVGSPNDQNITSVRVEFTQSGSFGGVAIPRFRVDNLFSTVPDYMNYIYYTMNKGTDTTGVTPKIFFTASTDIPYFGAYAPDLLDPIALRAAYVLEPQLHADKDFMKMYREECEQVLRVFGRIYPRKRVVNMGQTDLKRPMYGI